MTKMAYHSLLAFGLLLLFMGGAASSFPQAMATLFAPQEPSSAKLYPSRAEIQAQLSPSFPAQPVTPKTESKTLAKPKQASDAQAISSATTTSASTPDSLDSTQSRVVKTASEPKASKKTSMSETLSKETDAYNGRSIDMAPVLIEYQDELVLEFPKQLATNKHLKRALSRLFLAPQRLTDRALLDKARLDLSKRPYYYRRVLDHQGKAIRYPAQAYAYAEHLLKQNAKTVTDPEGQFLLLTIPLTDYGLSDQAKTYQAWVEEYARQFQVPPSLVYAVMETESSFNPLAVSRSNAIGLMQIKAGAAGRDVYELIDARAGQPTIKELFDSQNNIRMGTAYLSLLKHDYLGGIENEKIKQMVTISSYNGGMRTVLGLFGDTPEKAIQRLNRLSPQNVYRTLRYQHQSDETRRYLDKVLQAEVRYRDMLQTA
jgi:membrane-bound lytic murein transglycosylase C